VVQVPEDVNKQFVRDPSDLYRFRFFLTFECEGLGEVPDDLGYNALWDGARIVRILWDV